VITKALPLCIIATLLTAAPQRSGAQTPRTNILFSDSDEDMDLGEAPSQKGLDT